MAARNYPLGKRGKVGEGPGQGTHAIAYNAKRGTNNWESTNAYDIEVPDGTPVYAVTSGTIGSQIGSLGSSDPRMAGLRLHLVAKGDEFYYAHLSKIVVHAGDRVTAGELLGYSGSANGVAHLHFAAKTGDPAAWFGGQPKTGPSDPAAPVVDPASGSPMQPVSPVDPVAGQGVDMGVQPAPVSTQPFEPPPGSGISSTNAYVADLWNRIASQPGASPDTLALAQNAQSASG